MKTAPAIFLSEIPEADWSNTSESVKRLVDSLVERIRSLEVAQQGLQEQMQRHSQNSSQPPSQDAPQGFKAKPKKKSGKTSGGQPGHEGHSQALYAPEQCQRIEEHYPDGCALHLI